MVDPGGELLFTYVYMYICIYVYIYIHIFIYECIYLFVCTSLINYPLLVCVDNTVLLIQLVRSGFRSLKDCQNRTQISSEHARQLVQVRCEHALNGNTVLFQSKPTLSEGKQKTTSFGKLYGQTPKRLFWVIS